MKYPYSTCTTQLEEKLGIMSLEDWDLCSSIEDKVFFRNKKMSRTGMGINNTMFKSLKHCFNILHRGSHPGNTGHLTVLFIDSIASFEAKRPVYYCRCYCGKITTIIGKNIRSGHTKSCGCVKQDLREKSCLVKYGVPVSSQAVSVKKKQRLTLEKQGMIPTSKLREMNANGMSCTDIAINVGYANNSAVHGRLQKAGHEVLNHHTVCYDVVKMHKMNTEGKMSCTDIALKLGYASASGVRNRLIAEGYTIKIYSHTSVPHRKLVSLLEAKGLLVVVNDRTIISPLELDIVLPDYNIAIEVNGLYWHSESNGKGINYHLNKTNKAIDKKFQLLHFWDYEILDNPELVLSMILAKCGIAKTYYARKLNIVNVDNNFSRIFFTDNHIQGSVGATHKLGLEDSTGEILCVLTVGKARYTKAVWEVMRFANKKNTRVVGGFSRLLKHFTNRNKGSVVSYANKRFSQGDVYEKIGFTKLHDSAPCYYYFHKNNNYKLMHRSKFMKHKLTFILSDFDPALSEVENMRNNGYDRVFDCGTSVYLMENE